MANSHPSLGLPIPPCRARVRPSRSIPWPGVRTRICSRRDSAIAVKQQALFSCPLLMRIYGGPCGAGFGLAGSLGRRFLTPVRSASQPRQNGGGGSLNSSRSIRKMRYPPFTQGLRLGACCYSFTSVLEVCHD